MPRSISISFSQLIDRPWEQYRASLASYLSLTGWLLVPGLLFIVSLLLYPTADKLAIGADLSGIQIAGVILYFLTKSIILPLVALWVYAAAARLAFAQAAGRRDDLRKIMAQTWKLFPATIGATVLFSLAVFTGYLTPLLPGVLLSLFTTGRFDMGWVVFLRNFLVVVGVFGAAYFSIRWFGEFQFGPVAVIAEEAKVSTSLKESAKMVRGCFWGSFFRSIVAKLIFFLLGAAGLWVATTLLNIVVSVVAATALFPALRIETLVFSLLSLVVMPIFITPLIALVDVHLYRSLRENV